MKLTVPHMGNSYIALEALLLEMGHEVVVPPASTKKTLNLGTKYSPESACLPLKINIGNFLEAIELGAEGIIMAGGSGPCRFGYYAQVQREILKDLGHEAEVIVLEPPNENFAQLRLQIQRLFALKGMRSFWRGLQLAWEKIQAVEELESVAHYTRPREIVTGNTSHLLANSLAQLRKASSVLDIRRTLQINRDAMLEMAINETKPLRIGIVGEIYTVLEPFVNLDLEERLGHLGVEVNRTVNLVEWIRDHLVLSSLRLYKNDHLRKLAHGYLRGFVGGHGLESVAHTVMLAQQKFDGVIHILPFTCMPEIVAQSVLRHVSADYHIPILSLVVDEHTGETGFQTRLEAFVDLIGQKTEASLNVEAK